MSTLSTFILHKDTCNKAKQQKKKQMGWKGKCKTVFTKIIIIEEKPKKST